LALWAWKKDRKMVLIFKVIGDDDDPSWQTGL